MMGWSPQCYIPSFTEIGPLVPEKKIFEEFLPYMGVAAILVRYNFDDYVNDIWPRSRNDIDLQYSHTFINSIGCLHLQTFGSQAARDSEKSTVFTFSYRKA